MASEPVERAVVTKADRDAALKHLGWESQSDLNYWAVANDIQRSDQLSQAFADHRAQAIAALTAERDALREALEYYAGDEPYFIDADDFGDRARAALLEKKP